MDPGPACQLLSPKSGHPVLDLWTSAFLGTLLASMRRSFTTDRYSGWDINPPPLGSGGGDGHTLSDRIGGGLAVS